MIEKVGFHAREDLPVFPVGTVAQDENSDKPLDGLLTNMVHALITLKNNTPCAKIYAKAKSCGVRNQRTSLHISWSAACAALVLLALAVIDRPSIAQLGTGVVVGSVYDSSGSVLPDSDVSITNLATSEVFSTKTNNAGSYIFPPVLPGTYQVSATHIGFKKQIQDNVVVQVGSRVAINLTLAVGSATQSVTVTSQPPDLNTTTASLGIAFDEPLIANLPVNSRAALALAALTPSAHSPFGADVEGQGDRGDQVYEISVSGGPPGETAIVADGVNLQYTTQGEANIDPTVDTLSEFKIESGTLDASYGYTAGGVINMATKSGTDQYHGSVYEYVRNDAFDAKNYFTAVNGNPPEFRYNQFGGTAGGPIIRTKAFFFGNYEEYNYIKAVPAFTTVPTPQERNGDFSDLFTSTGAPIILYDPATTAPNPKGSGQVRQPFPANNVASEIDPVASAYQSTFYPLPNTTPTNAFTHANNYEGIVRTVNTMRQAMGRADYRVTQADNAFVRYWFYQFLTNNPDLLSSAFWRLDDMKNQNLVVGDTHVFSPHMFNELRVSGTLNLFLFGPGGQGQDWPQKLGLPSSVPVNQLPSMSNGLPTPVTTQGYRGRVRWEFTDTLTKTLGNHALSIGTDYRKSFDSGNYGSGISGLYTFSTSQTDNPQQIASTGSQYASFLIGDVASTSFATWLGATDRQNMIAFFVQDSWKATQSLTLNFGLRYDYFQQPYEQNNHYSSWNPNVTDSTNGLKGAYQYAGVDGVGRNFMNENYLNFGPRVGFAWTFGPGQHSVVRGGYGIYYALQNGTGFAGSQTGFSNTTTYAAPSPYQIFHLNAGIPSAPIAPLGAALGPAAFLGQSVTYTHAYAPSPTSQLMNLTVEQELPWGLVAQATAERNFGIHFPTIMYSEDALNPQYYSLGLALQNQVPNPYYGIIPSTSSIGGPTISMQQSLLPYPYYTGINGNYNHEGWYIANMGEFQLTERNRRGLTVIAGYTIGKEIDVPIEFASAPFANGLVTYSSTTYQNVYDRAADRSLDDADVSQRATISVLYDLPFGKGREFSIHNPLLNAIAGGWQINDITILQKGFPVAIKGASNNLATRPNYVPGVSANLSHRTKAEWFNTAAFVNPPLYTFGNVPATLPNVRQPGAFNFDTSLFKEFALHDSLKLSFRAEAFNVFNHPELGPASGAFSPGSNGLNASGTFGTITTTSIDNRELQFALKLLF
jgi:hypothetical protein